MRAFDTIALTRDLLHYNTINPPGQERDCARHLGKLLQDAGFAVNYHEFADGRTSLIASIGGKHAKPPICFTGHIDIVPLGTAAWARDPFAGETDGDKVYGRGSTDMKSGIAASVAAAINLAPHLADKPGVVLVLTAGEEIGCEGAKYLADQKLLGRAGAIVVAEPTANYPYIGHKGLLWVEIETTGKTAHGSMPEQGENAILKMNRVIDKLEHFDWQHHCGADCHHVMGKPSMNIATIHGGLNTNSVPDSAQLTVDIRTVPGIEHAHLCRSIQSLIGELGHATKLVDVPPLYSEPDEWIESVFAAATPFTDNAPTAKTIMFSTDGADLKRGYSAASGISVPAVVLGPGQPELAHQTDEWCSLARIGQSVELFEQLMREWNGL
ncbi:MAG: M20 family metallopeptidase [Betaproteobacteria bacterium]|nr:M20 family metallopeptidase [Betaproteobacteria bacterium]